MLPKFYYDRQKRKRQKTIWMIGTVFLVLTITVFSFLWFYSPSATDVIKPANQPTLSQTATLELTTLYTCGHSSTSLLPLPKDLAGKSQEETVLLYPQWTLLNFNENFIVAEEKETSECDAHFLLFLEGDRIIVTNSKDKTKIVTEQKINPVILTKEDTEILSAGIFINSEYELLEIMESFR